MSDGNHVWSFYMGALVVLKMCILDKLFCADFRWQNLALEVKSLVCTHIWCTWRDIQLPVSGLGLTSFHGALKVVITKNIANALCKCNLLGLHAPLIYASRIKRISCNFICFSLLSTCFTRWQPILPFSGGFSQLVLPKCIIYSTSTNFRLIKFLPYLWYIQVQEVRNSPIDNMHA